MVKPRNNADALFGHNPEGRDDFRATLRCSSLIWNDQHRSSRLGLHENRRRRIRAFYQDRLYD